MGRQLPSPLFHRRRKYPSLSDGPHSHGQRKRDTQSSHSLEWAWAGQESGESAVLEWLHIPKSSLTAAKHSCLAFSTAARSFEPLSARSSSMVGELAVLSGLRAHLALRMTEPVRPSIK